MRLVCKVRSASLLTYHTVRATFPPQSASGLVYINGLSYKKRPCSPTRARLRRGAALGLDPDVVLGVTPRAAIIHSAVKMRHRRPGRARRASRGAVVAALCSARADMGSFHEDEHIMEGGKPSAPFDSRSYEHSNVTTARQAVGCRDKHSRALPWHLVCSQPLFMLPPRLGCPAGVISDPYSQRYLLSPGYPNVGGSPRRPGWPFDPSVVVTSPPAVWWEQREALHLVGSRGAAGVPCARSTPEESVASFLFTGGRRGAARTFVRNWAFGARR